jgi:hypothetical protein
MTATDTEIDVGRIIVEVFADYLRGGEARQKVLKDNSGAVVSRTVLDSVDLALSGNEHVQDLQLREQFLIDERSDEGGQDRVARDGHSKG